MSFPHAHTSFPRAIVHIDGDSFFASCEQSREPSLAGKPVVTGMERGIASSMSLEAKKLGITRATSIAEIKKKFPHVIIIPSDYETYSLLSARFMDIVRRYTPDVEEYGIDECFADITGLRRAHRTSYENICLKIQKHLTRDLNCTFSIGLAPSKTLAKVGSKWKKSDGRSGFTAISTKAIPEYLTKLPIGDVWNIGPQTTAFLHKYGIHTAYQFASREESWIRNTVNINFYQTWQELRGTPALQLSVQKGANTHSIQRVRTFSPPSNDPQFLLAKLTENIDVACARARRYNSEARDISLFLKTQDFHYYSMKARLSRPTNFSHEIADVAVPLFDKLYQRCTLYRATGVTLSNLSVVENAQQDLFGTHLKIEKMGKVYASVDTIGRKYGKHSIHVGTSFLHTRRSCDNHRERQIEKMVTNQRKHKLGYPLLLGEFLSE